MNHRLLSTQNVPAELYHGGDFLLPSTLAAEEIPRWQAAIQSLSTGQADQCSLDALMSRSVRACFFPSLLSSLPLA